MAIRPLDRAMDMEMGYGTGIHVIRCSCRSDQNTLLELHGCCDFGGNDVDLLASTCIDRDAEKGESGQNTLIVLKSRSITHTSWSGSESEQEGGSVCARGHAKIALHYKGEEMQFIETTEPWETYDI